MQCDALGRRTSTGISPLRGTYPTTAALIEGGEPDWRAGGLPAIVPFASVEVLWPVTTPCHIYCRAIKSGMDPDAKQFNMFFTKSDASVSSAIVVGSWLVVPSRKRSATSINWS